MKADIFADKEDDGGEHTGEHHSTDKLQQI